jgi:hypothetical protein
MSRCDSRTSNSSFRIERILNSNMIGYFPGPLPDETLFSICARYRSQTSLSSKKVRKQLFGLGAGGWSHEFPNRLSFLANQLSWTGIYSEEQILQHHTFFPIYAPFVSKERQDRIKKMLLGNDNNHVYTLVRYQDIDFGKAKLLRFCPVCSQEDKEKYGVRYWHRLHQIKEVLVCPKHMIMLENAPSAQVHQQLHSSPGYANADESISMVLPRACNGPQCEYLKMLAEDSLWLLTAAHNNWDSNDVAIAYRALLQKKNFATRSLKRVFSGMLVNEIRNFYPEDFLSLVDSSLPKCQSQRNWLAHFFANPRKTMRPIRHIILIRYLGINISEFYQYVTSHKNAWPVSISFSFKDSSHKNIEGRLFSSSQNAQKKILKSLWLNANISVADIGRRLNLTTSQVLLMAARMGLYKTPKGRQGIEEKRKEKRKEWLAIRDAKPDATLAELRSTKSNPYNWLKIHDLAWLRQNKPTSKRREKLLQDWLPIDRRIAHEIPNAARAIINQPGRPVRASQRAILGLIDKYETFIRHHKVLPMTNQVLSKYAESREGYWLRKIKWAIEYYSERKLPVSRKSLFRYLKLDSVKDNRKIMHAFEEAVEELKRN